MHTSKRMTIAYLAMASALLALFALNLFWGSIALSPADIAATLLGRRTNALAADILLQLRLPRAVMVVLLGAALSVAGYLLQTFFANPIAGPFVMGISSGAKLAVALTMVADYTCARRELLCRSGRFSRRVRCLSGKSWRQISLPHEIPRYRFAFSISNGNYVPQRKNCRLNCYWWNGGLCSTGY